MLVVSVLILTLSAIIYGVEKYLGSRQHTFSSLLILILIYVMLAGNSQNADITNYEITYKANSSQWSIQIFAQWAYYLVINICNSFHLTFVQYRFVVYGIGLLALIGAIKKSEINIYPVLFLYYLVPMIIDATQMKTFIAMCIITLAITFLASGSKRDKIISIILIIIGGGFHITTVVFLPLVVLCDTNYNRKTKILSILPLVIFALLFSNRRMSSILSSVLLNILSDTSFNRGNSYLLSHTNYGYLIYFVATFVFIYIIIYLRKIILNCEFSTENEKRFSNVAFYCSIFSLVFLPLYFIKLDFARLLRMLIPIYHIMFVMTFGSINRQYDNNKGIIIRVNSQKIIVVMMYIFILAFMFYWEIYSFKDSVLMPFFEHNIFIK